MNPRMQSEWVANNWSADEIDFALRTLIDNRTLIEGAQGKVDSEAEKVLRDAAHMRRVIERVESVLPERTREDQLDPRG